jgi:hypothetical protein
MKLLKTIVSIVFLVGTIAIIVIDSGNEHAKNHTQVVKSDSLKGDSLSHALIRE